MKKTSLVLGIFGLALAGCVTPQQYRQAQKETEMCRLEKQGLQQQVDALNAEKNTLAQTTQEKDAELNKLKGTYDQLVGSLQNEISKGEIQVTQLKDKLTVNMVDKILFDSGKAQLKETGMEVLNRIGEVLNKVQDKDIRIEGHTDNVPLGKRLKERYPSNWELSTARATNVVRYLQEKGGVDPTRLIASGYGEYHPVAPNDVEENQAQNRRIDIVLVAREIAAPASKAAPAPAKSTPTAPTSNTDTPSY